MVNCKITIKSGSGRYNLLDKLYNTLIKDSLAGTDEETIERWYTYETIMSELISLNKINLFEEIKYKLTGGEDPNEIILDIISKDKDIKTTLWVYIRKLKAYKNEDLLKRFYQ